MSAMGFRTREEAVEAAGPAIRDEETIAQASPDEAAVDTPAEEAGASGETTAANACAEGGETPGGGCPDKVEPVDDATAEESTALSPPTKI